MPSQLLQKHFTAQVKGIDTEGKRVTGVLASSGSLDRDEEIILPEAWSLEAFKRNPIFLFAHASRSADPQNILGRVENVEKTTAGLVADFAYDTDINPKAAMVFAQVQRGTLRAFSVGFVPRAWVTERSPREHLDALPEHARKALETGKAYVVYTNVELIEISQVPVPSNPDAMIASMKAARLAELKHMEEEMSKPAETPAPEPKKVYDVPELVAKMERVAERLEKAIDAADKAAERLEKAAPAPVVEEEPAVIDEAWKALMAMDDAQLDAFFRGATEQERADALALIQ